MASEADEDEAQYWYSILRFYFHSTEPEDSPAVFETVGLALTGSFLADEEGVGPALQALTETDTPTRYAHHAVGFYYEFNKKYRLAATNYEKEFRLFPERAKGSAKRAVDMWLKTGGESQVESLVREAAFRDALPASVWEKYYRERKNWLQVARFIWPSQHEKLPLGIYGLGGIAGLVWLLFLTFSFKVNSEKFTTFFLMVLGGAAGMVSIIPTLLAYYFVKDQYGFDITGDLVPDLLYCVMGIGLIEEFCKLLLFMPFVPFLIRSYNPLRVFMVAAAVGLGFAVDENLNYFNTPFVDNISTLGRLLTANFLHISTTGLTGLAFCRMIRNPRRNTEYFLMMFGGVVLAHGVYDALIITKLAKELSYFSGTVFVLLAYRYFHEFNALHEPSKQQVSLTYILMCGISVVTVCTYVYLVSVTGSLKFPFIGMGTYLVSMGVFIIMYLREIPETIE